MSDVMLHGVLNMPPELWGDSEIDKAQRYSRYLEASRKIEDLTAELEKKDISQRECYQRGFKAGSDSMRDKAVKACADTGIPFPDKYDVADKIKQLKE